MRYFRVKYRKLSFTLPTQVAKMEHNVLYYSTYQNTILDFATSEMTLKCFFHTEPLSIPGDTIDFLKITKI